MRVLELFKGTGSISRYFNQTDGAAAADGKTEVVVDYCYFGYPYKKPTRILTNKVLENRRCACTRHQYQIGITTRNKLLPGQAPDKTTTIQRYEVPKDLIEYLLA